MAKRNVELRAPRTGKYNSPSDLKPIYVPHTIYYYYVKATAVGGVPQYDEAILYVVEKNVPIPEASLDAEIIALTKNARGTQDNPKPKDRGFGRLPWQRRSYLIVALDDYDVGNGFEIDNAVEITRKDGSNKRYPNHCFFDGGEREIQVQDEDPIRVMWTVNYMKNKTGKDIPERKFHTFSFKFNPKGVPFAEVLAEDNGTNMGPPVGPP